MARKQQRPAWRWLANTLTPPRFEAGPAPSDYPMYAIVAAALVLAALLPSRPSASSVDDLNGPAAETTSEETAPAPSADPDAEPVPLTPQDTPAGDPPGAPNRKLRGVNVFLKFGAANSAKLNDQQFALAENVQADVIRSTIPWASIEPWGKGGINSYFIADLDRIVDQAAQHNLQIIFGLGGSPCWASADPRKNCERGQWQFWYPPAKVSDYADALAFLTHRYEGRVLAWEVWNEPNHPEFWGGKPSAARYVQLVKAARAANPSAFLLAGALAGSDSQYAAQMFNAGLSVDDYDALSMHPYAETPDTCADPLWTLRCGVPNLHDLLKSHGDDRGEIWFTEFGWSNQQLTEAKQARYLKRAYELVGSWDYVPVAAVFSLLDRGWDTPGFPSDNLECCFGLFRADTSAKPAADTFREALVAREPTGRSRGLGWLRAGRAQPAGRLLTVPVPDSSPPS
jgi:polysaccharide biosynthesis protein PslG